MSTHLHLTGILTRRLSARPHDPHARQPAPCRLAGRRNRPPAFTLIELLVVVAVVSLLISLLLPSLSGARHQARAVQCASNLRELGRGWHMYADAHNGVSVPMRFPGAPGGVSNPANWYDVGNGLRYRPRWIAAMGKYVGLFAYEQPRTDVDRQDYDGKVYHCPEVPEWVNDRNAAYGYNYQFLGNSRKTAGVYHNYPVNISRVIRYADTVLGADCMGTAAGVPASQRLEYNRQGSDQAELGNHGYTLDPPRLTARSDRGTGDPGTKRTAVDLRHGSRANAVFCDGHVSRRTPRELGYRTLADGTFVDLEPVPPQQAPDNRLFSGTGEDADPPPLPR